MAVPTSGAISMRGVAKERRYNDVGVNGYVSGSTTNLTNISMYDLMRGGNTNGSNYNFCPPMDNVFQVNGFNVTAPYDPNLEQGSGVNATPYALSEFRGHVGNRELGCMKVNYNTACFTGSSMSASAAGQSFRLEFDLEYTPKGTGALIYITTNQTWGKISSTSDTTGGSGSQNVNFSAASGSTIRYLNVATNSTTSSRSLTLSVYITGSCYSSDNLLHTVTVTQAAGSGGGGGGGFPSDGGGFNP